MTLGLCCSQPACRPHPASLPVRVPTVEGLLRASFGCYTLRFATVAVIGSGWLLSSNEILPMLGTLGRTPGSAADAPVGLRGACRRRVQGYRPTKWFFDPVNSFSCATPGGRGRTLHRVTDT